MRYKATFVAGFATGYVFGARAGRARYEAIMRRAREFAERPEVQETAGVLQAQAGGLAKTAKDFVQSKVSGRSEDDVPDYPSATGAPSTNGHGAPRP